MEKSFGEQFGRTIPEATFTDSSSWPSTKGMLKFDI